MKTLDRFEGFDSVGRDTRISAMPGWQARDSQNFVRDTNDGHRVNVYWSCGGYWLIQEGLIREGDWQRFVGRQGRNIKGWCGWKKLATAKFHADWFASLHGEWVGTTSHEVGN